MDNLQSKVQLLGELHTPSLSPCSFKFIPWVIGEHSYLWYVCTCEDVLKGENASLKAQTDSLMTVSLVALVT